MAISRAWRVVLLACAIGLAGSLASSCGGGQTRGHPLDSSWSDEDGSELAAFQKQLRPSIGEPPIDVAVGVVDERTLIGRALGSRNTWRFEHPLESRPAIAGSVVVGIGGDELFALDAETGRLLWTRKALGRLRGASDDGTTTLVSLASLSGVRSTVLAIDRSGKVLRQLYLNAAIGRPLVADAYAFLPYNREMVLIFDLLEGTEAARVVADYPVSHAFRVGPDIFFGEHGAVRFDDQIVSARQGEGSRVELAPRDFPRRPRWRLPGSMPAPTTATRDDTLRIYARPESRPQRLPSVDRYALSYFSLVVGVEGPEAETSWVHRGAHLYLGGWCGLESVALCDSAGTVRWLDRKTGAELQTDALGQSLLACEVQSEAPPHPIKPLTPPGLSRQLAQALADPRPELTLLQHELLDELAAIPGAATTENLVTLAREDASTSEPIRSAAINRIAERRTGLGALLDALDRDAPRPAWQASALPLAAMAAALRHAPKGLIPRAADALAQLLGDRTAPASAAVATTATLESLLTAEPTSRPRARRPLVRFLAAHHCPEPSMDAAVIATARMLRDLGATGPVRRAAHGPCDRASLKASLQAVLDAPRAPRGGGGPTP